MKTFAVATICVLLLAGCGRIGSIGGSPAFTSFFNSHDAEAHLGAVAKAAGYSVGGGGAGKGVDGSTGMKDFSVSIKGDDKSRDRLMRDYKDFVEKELTKAGVTIHGREVGGNVSRFDFQYDGPRTSGIFRANAVVDANGYIEFDVLMYEHR